MTTTVKDVAAKFAVAIVGVAMIFSLFATPAAAQTNINDLSLDEMRALLAELSEILAAQNGGDTMSTSSVCPYTWTRDLAQGAEGADVMKLQQFLNGNPETRVAAAGVGSAGNETTYYGPATAAAVSNFQVKYRAEILTPAGLVSPTGYFGPSTRVKANSLCTAAPVATPATDSAATDAAATDAADTNADATTDADADADEGPVTLRGEGELEVFEIEDAEDTVTEGEENAVVMVLTVGAENGDLELSRLDFSITENDSVANEEDEPWDVFKEFSLWVDDEKIASFEADNEDDYLDTDSGEEEFRFRNIDLVLLEDEEVEIEVAVSVANSVDGSDTANEADWFIEPTSVRVEDADGIVETLDEVDEMLSGLDTGEQEEFDIEERGADDGGDIASNSNNRDASGLLVDADDESEEHVVHIFDVEIDRDSTDLVLKDVFVDVTITNPATSSSIAGGQDDVISEIYLTIDGEEVKGDATSDGADSSDDDIAANGGDTTVRYLFEFDEDVTLDSDTDYKAEVSVVFLGQDNNYTNGITIETSVDGSLWEAEGSEDDDNLDGTDTSETHTLSTVVPVFSGQSFTLDKNEDDSGGTISYTFTIEADGEGTLDFDFASTSAVNGNSDDVRFTITGTDPSIASASIRRASGDATAKAGGTGWTIEDGDSARFELNVTFTTAASTDDGAYSVLIDSIEDIEIDESSDSLNLSN